MRFTLDTNILFHAFDRSDPEKHAIALRIVSTLQGRDVLFITQVLGEFLAVVRRRNTAVSTEAIALVNVWSQLFPTVGTDAAHLTAAAALSNRYRLQFWNSVILTVAKSAGAGIFVSEDMQDGAVIDGVTLLNPFAAGNRDRLAALLVG